MDKVVSLGVGFYPKSHSGSHPNEIIKLYSWSGLDQTIENNITRVDNLIIT